MSDPKKPFFVGYLPAPGPLRAFLISTILSLFAFFAIVSWTIASTQADPGPGRFLGGAQTLIGVLETEPYPIVHVTEGSNRVATGKTILLSGGGKTGVQDRVRDYDGQVVRISGQALERGSLQMLQLRGGMRGLAAMEDTEENAISRQDLGRWRLEGEICDGKCLAGAMRPGTGLAHRACANFCLVGGVPPVFVSSQPVEGSEFLLIGDQSGGPLTEEILDHTALFVRVEGRIERRGDLLVFLIDPATLEVL